MGRVVALEDGLAKQKEVVLVLADKDHTGLAITIDVPDVIINVHLDVVL